MENRRRILAAAKNGQVFYQNSGTNVEPPYLDEEKIAYLMYKQSEQHQQLMNAQAAINNTNNMHATSKQPNLFQNMPKNSTIDYHKWLLSTGRQHLIENPSINQIINHPMPIDPHQYIKQHQQQHQNNHSADDELMRVKQELLGYKKEIELLHEQRKYAKLVKQQRQQQQYEAEMRHNNQGRIC